MHRFFSPISHLTLPTDNKKSLLITKITENAYIFLGIHYAESPAGSNRWKLPIPKTPWNGILNAVSDKKSCIWKSTPQTDPFIVEMTEDCLYLDVFTSKYCLKTKNCSVIFFVHGGNFIYSSPHAVNKDFIDNYLTKDRSVITVIPAYRLGLFGYFNLTTFKVSDLIAALRWVQEDIKSFGGDANHVTLMGHSSGATDANLVQLKKFFLLRKKRHKINIFTGTTKHETRSTAYTINTDGSVNKVLLQKECLEMMEAFGIRKPEKALDECTSYYSNGYSMLFYFSLMYVFCSSHIISNLNDQRLHSEGGRAFIHEYQYEFAGKAFDYPRQKFDDPHPMHVEHLLYILGHYSGNFTKTDEIIRKKFSQLIVNFVNNGDPSPRSDHIFQPYNKQRGNYIAVDMHENNDVTVVKYNYHKDKKAFLLLQTFPLHNFFRLGEGIVDTLHKEEAFNSSGKKLVKRCKLLRFLKLSFFINYYKSFCYNKCRLFAVQLISATLFYSERQYSLIMSKFFKTQVRFLNLSVVEDL
ncbi:unnamed protein product [Enterobius vermicularis]|uniref:Carboxylic ester hydrolase n=1 Tax=Enterobius vermicularis TaxID=51028 RepID=A0A3P6IES3_ENTVE|nr:unnamed protein product [Enterobius vermicularis]